MQLDLTDGTTTIILSSGSSPTRGATYFPQAPANAGDMFVKETATLLFGGTDSQIRALTQQIDNWFYLARLRQEAGAGPRIWLEYRPVAGDTLYRSLLFDGKLNYSANPELRRLRDGNLTAEITVEFTRQPFWEGALTELPLAANGQGSATGGRTIHNKSDDWVEIASGDVAGTLPGSVKFSLANATGSNQSYVNFYIATGAFNDAPNFSHVIEGESFSGATSTASAGASNGLYGLMNFGSAGNYQISYAIPSAQVSKCAGRFFRVLLRFLSAPASTLYITPRLIDTNSGNVLVAGQEVAFGTASSTLLDAGDLPIPPSPNPQTFSAATLGFLIRTTGSNSLSLDFAQLTPTDAFRHLRLVGGALVNGQTAVDDNTEDEAYSDDGVYRYISLARLAGPLWVWPGRTQRIYTLYDKALGVTVPGDTATIRAWYRPRRVTV